MGDRVIDIFTSPNGKRIIAIDEDSGISAIHAVGRIMLIGTDEAISQLRISLNSERDGWTKEAIEACKFKLPKLTSEQKADILKLHSGGHKPRDIAILLKLNSKQVSGFVQGHVRPVQVNMAKKAATSESDKRQSAIDKIISDGRRAKHDYVNIADTINRKVGGIWQANDVHKRIEEMRA